MGKPRVSDEIAADLAERLGLFRTAASAMEDFKIQLANAVTCQQLAVMFAFWSEGKGASRLYADGGEATYAQAMRELGNARKNKRCP